MGVDEVIAQPVLPGEGEHGAGERGQLSRQLLLAQPLIGPGHAIDHPHAVSEFYDLPLQRPGGTSEDVHT